MQECINCGAECDSYHELGSGELGDPQKNTPDADSIGVCSKCHFVHSFTNEGKIVPLTEEQEKSARVTKLRVAIAGAEKHLREVQVGHRAWSL